MSLPNKQDQNYGEKAGRKSKGNKNSYMNSRATICQTKYM